MKEKKYTRLTAKERLKIEIYLSQRKTVTEIARLLNRPKSTISREIKRGSYLGGKRYIADYAQAHAEIRNRVKRPYPKIMIHAELRRYVLRGLVKGWSPEQISNMIKLDYPLREDMRTSYEAIYRYIYDFAQESLRRRLIAYLPYSKAKRIGSSHRHIYMGSIPDRVSIDCRPKDVESREEVGHWESDLVIGKDQKSAIGTLVERKTRYTIIVPLKSRKSEHVVERFCEELLKLPKQLLKSITHDNGIEMAAHKTLTKNTGMSVYFAHPYSSWERGTNENTNGLIRRVFKKGTDFRKVTVRQLKQLERSLNDRPRKVLKYSTPKAKLLQECA